MSARSPADGAGVVRACPRCGQANRIPFRHLAHSGRCGACKQTLAPTDSPIEADAGVLDALVRESDVPVLVDFWASWCAPCRIMAPELARLASTRAGKLVVAKVDTDRNPELARRHGIEGLPTLLLFREGRPGAHLSGARSAAAIARELGL